jgi:4-amino-4-deoxy-L-arabinose transferase-like glycosyltransferase
MGVGLRSYFLLSTSQTNSDGVLYAWIGGNIADGYGYTIAEGTSLSDARMWHVPAYPFVLAAFYSVFGKGLLVSKLPAFVFGLMTIILFYSLCKMLFDEETALIGSLFLAIHPQLVFFSSEVMAESMYTFFLLLFLFILLSQNRSKDVKPYLLTGIIAGVCYLTRTVGILTLLVFALYTIYQNKKDFIEREVGVMGGFLLIVLPWWLWSISKYGTAFSAEQNTLIQMYQFEFGSFQGTHLNLFSYLFGYHDLPTILSGFFDGALKLLIATFIPKILYFMDVGVMRILVLLILTVVLFVFLTGVWSPIKKGRWGLSISLLGILILGVIGYAWGVHVIPPKSATIFRYTLPLTLIIIIYLAVGIKNLLEKNKAFKLISIVCFLLIVASSLSITYSNYKFNRSFTDSFYSYAVSDLPKDSPVLASNPDIIRKLGFNEVYPVSDMDFSGLLNEADDKKIRYLIIDTSSLHNDDQFYLVNYWYIEKIPKRIKKISGDLFPITVYEIL